MRLRTRGGAYNAESPIGYNLAISLSGYCTCCFKSIHLVCLESIKMSDGKYSIDERRELLEIYHNNGRNVTTTLRKFGTAHRDRKKPSHGMVKALIEKFERVGHVHDESRSGRRSTSRAPDLIDKARIIVEKTPGTTVRELGRELEVSKTSAHSILREDLGKFPYKLKTGQELKQRHLEERLQLASEICELIDRKILDPMKIISTDESHFHLSGYINRQNNRLWASEKPTEVNQRPLHPKYTTVWAALSLDGIEHFQFVRDQKVTGAVYRQILDEFIRKMIENGKTTTHWLQQDGARAHTTRENLEIIKEAFGHKVISRRFPEIFEGEEVGWPANSPDLSPMDFFVWGRTKELVYKTKPKNLDELEDRIGEVLRSIPADSSRRTFESFEERMRMVVCLQGAHIEIALNKK